MQVYFALGSPGGLVFCHDMQTSRSFVLSFENVGKVETNNSRSYKTFVQGVICTGMEHQEKTWIVGLSVLFSLVTLKMLRES